MRITYIGREGNRKHFEIDPDKTEYVIVNDDSMLIINNDLTTEYIHRYDHYGWDEVSEECRMEDRRWKFKCKLNKIVDVICKRRMKKLE